MTHGPAPMCASCVHLRTEPQAAGAVATCTAFPDGIPSPIYWDARIDHRQAWPGDGGTRFAQDPDKPIFDFASFVEARGPSPVSPG